MTDYYAILGVARDADENDIRARYRKLAKEFHPDLHPGDKEAEARFKEIGEAWAVIGDAESRVKYDSKRAQQRTTQKKSHSAPMGEVDYSKMMSQFDSFFGKSVTMSPGAKQANNHIDATGLFEKFMGMGYKK